MNKSAASRLGQNKPAKYIYQLLQQHHTYVRTHECPKCYTKAKSLIVEHSIIEHVVSLSAASYSYADIVDILNDLQDMELIERTQKRNGLFELKFLQLLKPTKSRAKVKAA